MDLDELAAQPAAAPRQPQQQARSDCGDGGSNLGSAAESAWHCVGRETPNPQPASIFNASTCAGTAVPYSCASGNALPVGGVSSAAGR